MGFTPHGNHLIAGAWVAGEGTFASDPAHSFSVALVDRAAQVAKAAFLA